MFLLPVPPCSLEVDGNKAEQLARSAIHQIFESPHTKYTPRMGSSGTLRVRPLGATPFQSADILTQQLWLASSWMTESNLSRGLHEHKFLTLALHTA